MNGTHQVLAYADDVNVTCDDIRTTERNTDVLLNCENAENQTPNFMVSSQAR